jgi:hypothetical protein
VYFSANTIGFYSAEYHGARLITVQDPAWIRPAVDVVLQPGESVSVGDELVTNTGEEPMTLRGVPDMGAVPDTLEVANPSCLIPADAVEITRELHAALLDGQSAGRVIASGADGYPVLVDPPPPSPEVMSAIERAWRDLQLAATDGVVSRHRDEVEVGASTTLTPEKYSQLQQYRQALRNWPESGEFPLLDHRPPAPPWLAEQSQ